MLQLPPSGIRPRTTTPLPLWCPLCPLPQAIPKPHDTNELILHAIEQSILFKNCGIEDLETLAEAFAPVHLDKGAQVITQVNVVLLLRIYPWYNICHEQFHGTVRLADCTGW